jgi:hypothetical protein
VELNLAIAQGNQQMLCIHSVGLQECYTDTENIPCCHLLGEEHTSFSLQTQYTETGNKGCISCLEHFWGHCVCIILFTYTYVCTDNSVSLLIY